MNKKEKAIYNKGYDKGFKAGIKAYDKIRIETDVDFKKFTDALDKLRRIGPGGFF